MNAAMTLRDKAVTTILTVLFHLAVGAVLVGYLIVTGVRSLLRRAGAFLHRVLGGTRPTRRR